MKCLVLVAFLLGLALSEPTIFFQEQFSGECLQCFFDAENSPVTDIYDEWTCGLQWQEIQKITNNVSCAVGSRCENSRTNERFLLLVHCSVCVRCCPFIYLSLRITSVVTSLWKWVWDQGCVVLVLFNVHFKIKRSHLDSPSGVCSPCMKILE